MTNFRADIVEAVCTEAAKIPSARPEDYPYVPCGMNSLIYLGKIKPTSRKIAEFKRPTSGKVIIISQWHGINGSSLCGEFKPYMVVV